jgi:predicted enzyme related to lactoylglutathione lyase
MTNPSVAAITFDCADAATLGAFWAEVLGRTVAADASAEYANVPGSPPLMFFAVPEGKTAKNRVHLDIAVDDLPTEVDRVVGLGAKRLGDFDESGFVWTTLADPEGNEFDLVQGGH